mmetsp:Transcript_47246/g.94122  ORF Transcript_47246/g.94122 Transcript_47246/m.94122 type:complete len:255 (+) Transcript_47246:46-810(+)
MCDNRLKGIVPHSSPPTRAAAYGTHNPLVRAERPPEHPTIILNPDGDARLDHETSLNWVALLSPILCPRSRLPWSHVKPSLALIIGGRQALETSRQEGQGHMRTQQGQDQHIPCTAECLDDRSLLRTELRGYTSKEPSEECADDRKVVGENRTEHVDDLLQKRPFTVCGTAARTSKSLASETLLCLELFEIGGQLVLNLLARRTRANDGGVAILGSHAISLAHPVWVEVVVRAGAHAHSTSTQHSWCARSLHRS